MFAGPNGSAAVWLCEVTDGQQIDYKQDLVPDWFFRYVVEKVS